MKKNTKKKFRDIRNAVVMMCVMVAMMSTASYAWFTLSSSPTVTGMQMTAATDGGGLKVANPGANDARPTTYYDNIIVTDTSETKMLRPVTPVLSDDPAEVGTFQSPIYSGNEVKGLAVIPTEKQDTYVAKYTFWIQSTATTNNAESVGVGIIIGNDTKNNATLNPGNDGGAPLANGSFVRKSLKNASPADVNDAANAVRVGLVIVDTTSTSVVDSMDKLIIWEPNADNEDNSSRAESATVDAGINSAIEDYIKVQSNVDGTIVKGGTGNISDALFTMEKGKEAKVDLYVWIEGSDLQCGNEIQAANLEAQIQFTAIEDTTSGGAVNP